MTLVVIGLVLLVLGPAAVGQAVVSPAGSVTLITGKAPRVAEA